MGNSMATNIFNAKNMNRSHMFNQIEIENTLLLFFFQFLLTHGKGIQVPRQLFIISRRSILSVILEVV